MNIETAKNIVHYMQGFSLVGFLLMIILGTLAKPATLSIITFGIVTLSLLISVFIPISLKQNFGSFKKLLRSNIPVFLTILLAIWTIIINSTYFENINDGSVAQEFYSFSFYSLIIMAAQVYISFVSLTSFLDVLSQNEGNGEQSTKSLAMKKKMNTIAYLITPLNIMYLSIMHVILAFFSTDG